METAQDLAKNLIEWLEDKKIENRSTQKMYRDEKVFEASRDGVLTQLRGQESAYDHVITKIQRLMKLEEKS
jgi:hypothetical protein